MKKSVLTLSLIYLTMFLFFTACSKNDSEEIQKSNGKDNFSQYEKELLHASWAYNYENISELARDCDLAAYVTITGWNNNDEYESSGVDLVNYTAEIKDSLIGPKEGNITIVMTGKIDETDKKIYEISDDPLMKTNDSFFIFARANEDGTYTILSGPQGRYKIVDDLVYSLNVNNEQSITVDAQPKEEFYAQIIEAKNS